MRIPSFTIMAALVAFSSCWGDSNNSVGNIKSDTKNHTESYEFATDFERDKKFYSDSNTISISTIPHFYIKNVNDKSVKTDSLTGVAYQIIRKVGVDNYYFRNIYTQEGYLQYTQFFDMTEEGYSDTVKSSQLRKFIMRNHDYKYEADGDYKLTEIPDGMHWLSITPGINLDNKSIWVVELSQYGKSVLSSNT